MFLNTLNFTHFDQLIGSPPLFSKVYNISHKKFLHILALISKIKSKDLSKGFLKLRKSVSYTVKQAKSI